MTSDQDRLSRYIELWSVAASDVLALLRDLGNEEWRAPTDLPGWDVQAVAAHLAHLESELSGVRQEVLDVPDSPHLNAMSSHHTEAGVLARASSSKDEILDEFDTAVDDRRAQLRDNPPTDATARAPVTPSGLAWDWETLLRNRPLDLWMHEQDIRRAVNRPGGLNSPVAAHTVTVLALGFPFVVGKRVAPPPGTSVVLDVTGVSPVHLAVEVARDGRAVASQVDPADASVRLRMDLETYVVLSGGRRRPDQVSVEVDGDGELGNRVLDAMAVTS